MCKAYDSLDGPTFLALPVVVAQTDAIGTVPRKLALSFLKSANIKLFKAAIKFPFIEIKQHWHERYHHDPANRWMRNVFVELFFRQRSTDLIEAIDSIGVRLMTAGPLTVLANS